MLKKFANDLKDIRESKDISLNDIYSQTKIHTSNFEKMENGEFNFQPQTYIRAFLRQYAKCLELDDNEVLRNYDLAKSGKYHAKTRTTEEHKPEQKQESKEESKREPKQEPKQEPKHETKSVPKTEPKSGLKSVPLSEPKPDSTFDSKFEMKSPQTSEIKEQTHESKKHTVLSESSHTESEEHLVKPHSTFYDAEKNKNILSKSVKILGILIVAGLIGYGIYLIGKSMFGNKSGADNNQIVRQNNSQNFDDVTKDYEKKVTGKRTPEEIQDSIKKAQQQTDSLKQAEQEEGLTLVVEAKRSANLIVISDTTGLDIKKQKVDKFKKGDVRENYKAKKFFLITSKNIDAFDIKLNGKKVDIKPKEGNKVENVRIPKESSKKNN
jgi:hypothetical protein